MNASWLSSRGFICLSILFLFVFTVLLYQLLIVVVKHFRHMFVMHVTYNQPIRLLQYAYCFIVWFDKKGTCGFFDKIQIIFVKLNKVDTFVTCVYYCHRVQLKKINRDWFFFYWIFNNVLFERQIECSYEIYSEQNLFGTKFIQWIQFTSKYIRIQIYLKLSIKTKYDFQCGMFFIASHQLYFIRLHEHEHHINIR